MNNQNIKFDGEIRKEERGKNENYVITANIWTDIPEQNWTAPKWTIWSGSTLFTIQSAILNTLPCNQIDLFRFEKNALTS